MNPTATTLLAFFIGTGLAISVELLSLQWRRMLEIQRVPFRLRCLRVAFVVASTVILFGLYQWAALGERCLDTPEVQPSAAGHQWRLAYHLTLMGLLIVATATDFDCYVIPDSITIPGILIGIAGACLIGEVQICHLWVDWSVSVPQISGPLIPSWYDSHRFWHALAWSLAGLITGAGLTFVARKISSQVLGQEAMGFGDVTLMAMIGSFVGWQAVTLVFLIAPLAGLTIGVLLRLLSGKTYLPYGPWLSIATVTVLFGWSHLWRYTRLIYSDWLSVAMLAVFGGVGFVLLLGLLQLYKSIPTRTRTNRNHS